jgi:hypothetical protein
MFTKISISTSLAGLLDHRLLSGREDSVAESFRQEEFSAYEAQEEEPVRLPRAEDLNQILNFALGMTLATDLVK